MIALFGGSFDPIHLGHCHLAKELQKRYEFKSLYFVPAKQNPLKAESTRATPEQRLEMLNLSLKELNETRFKLLDWEIKRQGPSYTVETLEKLATLSKDIALILGSELVADLPRWKSPEKILKMAHLIVVIRDQKAPDIEDLLGKFEKSDRWIDTVDVSALPYSATAIRSAIQEKWKTKALETPPPGLQQSVWAYVKEQKLYSQALL